MGASFREFPTDGDASESCLLNSLRRTVPDQACVICKLVKGCLPEMLQWLNATHSLGLLHFLLMAKKSKLPIRPPTGF